jgi:hypothetical protein
MRPLIAQRMATPPQIEEQLGGALVIECYRIGNCAAIVSRRDVADGRSQTRDFRWHLTLSHSERAPTWDEINIARTLLPDDIHFCVPYPHSGFAPKEGLSFHFWEIKDSNLTEQWEYDSVLDRGEQHGTQPGSDQQGDPPAQ